MLGNGLSTGQQEKIMIKKRVVIIGAGAAGLSVAQQLRKQDDYQVIHLEAQAEVGGRVKGVSFAGLNLDSGACFLHHKTLELYQEAKQRKWLAKTGKVGVIVNGRYLPSWRFAIFHLLPSMQKSKRLIRAFYRNADPLQTLEALIEEQGFNHATAHFYRQVLGVALGGAVDQVGSIPLKESFKTAKVRPEQDLINQALSKPLSELLGELFSEQISLVETEQVVSEIDCSQSQLVVRCTNGEVFQADKVVITVPLAILKKGSIHFNPPLPVGHQQAIDSLGMGQGGKFFLQFSQRLWKSGVGQIINTDAMCQFWVPEPTQPILVAFYVEKEGELHSGAQRLQLLLDALSQVFACDVEALLIDHHHEAWSFNPYIAGLYSYDRVGSEGARTVLQQPIREQLFLAGEATIEGHFATVDGAIESGKRVARQLLGEC